HIGLIIILIAALLRMTSVMYLDEYVWVREGEQVVIPGTNSEYYIENKQFLLEVYDENDPEEFQETINNQDEMIAKNYQSDVVIYKAKEDVVGAKPELEPYIEDEIRMNHPLKFDKYTLYQAGYQLDEFSNMTFKVYETDDDDAKAIDEFTIDLNDPEDVYERDNVFKVDVDVF